MSEIHGGTSSKQWGSVVSRLAALDGFGDKENRKEPVFKTKGMRDDVAHNTLVNPSKDKLRDIRENVEEWETWVSDWVERYVDRKAEISPRELMQNMMQNMVKEVDRMHVSHFDDEKDELDAQIVDLKEKIDSLGDQESFSLKHVEVFKKVQELHAEAIKLEEKEMEYEVHMEEMVDEYRRR